MCNSKRIKGVCMYLYPGKALPSPCNLRIYGRARIRDHINRVQANVLLAKQNYLQILTTLI
jgi:hypothetical protein